MTTRNRRIVHGLGAAAAVLVPALVVAQVQTQFASTQPFSNNQQLSAARLNSTSTNACVTIVRALADCGAQNCIAECPANFGVISGGCRTNGVTQAMRASTPRLGGGFPDPDSFRSPLPGGPVTDLGQGAPTAASPPWTGWSCEAVTGATIQTAYAICCPFTSSAP